MSNVFSPVVEFRTRAGLDAEESDRSLLKNSLGWVEHFARFGDGDMVAGLNRRLLQIQEIMESRLKKDGKF